MYYIEDEVEEMNQLILRSAQRADVAQILEIHNQGIADRVATLDLEPHTMEGKLEWFDQLKEEELVLVAEVEGQVVGFAALTRYSSRKCDDGVGMLSIYIDRAQRGQGVGSRLLAQLIQEAKGEGYRKIILLAFPFNQAGIALYEKYGFKRVGIHKNHGWLDDRWVDILVMESLL